MLVTGPRIEYSRIKRFLDVLFAALLLIALFPLFLVISLSVIIDSPHGGVLFRQRRIGCNLTEFEMLKFRSMRVDAPRDSPTHLLEDANSYITRVGKVLRKTSLDELPQLVNILLGQMSFVGPRPALWNQDDLIAARDARGANDIRPGLTGLAQISGRDELNVSDKAELDGKYAAKMSFWLDVYCLAATVVAVVRAKGVSEGATCATEGSKTYE